MRDSLGHYKILDRLGAGGIGEVYRARDTRLGRTVAIKVASQRIAEDPDRRALFLRDAQASATLSHPGIAELCEIGDDEGVPFLVFEFIPGEPLSAIAGGGPIHPRRAIDFAIQIADALADAHSRDVSHLDLRPDNIIVTPKGHAKILDFGLASWTFGGGARREAAQHLRAESVGAPARGRPISYVSPEEALGDKGDHRSDIFSLGTILFELLTGKLPFAASTPAAEVRDIVGKGAPAPRTLDPKLPPQLDRIVSKMLIKNPDDRWDAAAMVAAELRSVTAMLDARKDAAEPVVVPAPSKSRFPGWAIAALVLAVIAALVWLAARAG